jgi:hypothetical protein
MMIIGVDFHPSFQTIAFLMEETGEYGEQELNHSDGQAEKFYGDLKQRGISPILLEMYESFLTAPCWCPRAEILKVTSVFSQCRNPFSEEEGCQNLCLGPS